MLRRLVFVALLCVFAWAMAERIAACPFERIAAAAGGSTDSADHQWEAQRSTSAVAHESVWRSQFHHAELAGVACPDLFLAAQNRGAPSPRQRIVPLHLHSTPLLI